MQTRIDRLENLVLSLMTNGAQAVSPEEAATALSPLKAAEEGTYPQEDSEVEHVSESIGVMKVMNDRQFFASEAHWWAILSDVSLFIAG